MFRKDTTEVVSFLVAIAPCEPWARILASSSKKKIPLRVFFQTFWKREDEGMSLSLHANLGSNPLFFFEEIKNTLAGLFYFLAEARGFEPPIHCCIHAFQACSFNHSDTLPSGMIITDIKYFYQI